MRPVHVHLHRAPARDKQFSEMERRPVYASMPLSRTSEEAVRRWAAGRGVRVPERGMHVTTAYSLVPVEVPRHYRTRDALGAEGCVAMPGGREIRRYGAQLVLTLDCAALHDRWMAWRQRGASWDYPDYSPHVTFADLKHNAGAVIDVSGAPFDDPIVLMPEVVDWPRDTY